MYSKNYRVVPIVDSNKIVIKIITSKYQALLTKKGIKDFFSRNTSCNYGWW